MNHSKKMIAPVIITIAIVLYFLGIGAFFLMTPEIGRGITALIIIISLLLSSVMVGVLMSRIREIRSGEEDDLSQY